MPAVLWTPRSDNGCVVHLGRRMLQKGRKKSADENCVAWRIYLIVPCISRGAGGEERIDVGLSTLREVRMCKEAFLRMRLQQDNYTNTSVRVRWWKKPLSAKALMQIFLVCVCCGLFALTSGRALDAVRASSNVVGAQDWNQYLHDPQNTAASNETILSTASCR